jgi:hypothetical protein
MKSAEFMKYVMASRRQLCALPPNMRMHLQKPRAPWSKAGRRRHASFQVIRGRWADMLHG